jgi:hypothetical protein
MVYTRKTKDVWAIMGNYGYGWEEVTAEDTKKDAIEQLKTYRDNENYPFKIKKYREKLNI